MIWQLLYILLGVIIGTLAVIYHITKKRLQTHRNNVEHNDLPTFFLNVLLLNKKQIIKQEVNKKVKHGLFGMRQKLVGALANRVVSDSKFTKNVGDKLTLGIPPKLKLQAIEATAELMFVKDSYCVIAVKIISVDSVVLIGKSVDGIGKTAFKMGKTSYLRSFLNCLSKIGLNHLRDVIDFFMSKELSTVAEDKMVEIMGEGVMQKLEKQVGIQCAIEVMHSRHQAQYFYKFLNELNNKGTATNEKKE